MRLVSGSPPMTVTKILNGRFECSWWRPFSESFESAVFPPEALMPATLTPEAPGAYGDEVEERA